MDYVDAFAPVVLRALRRTPLTDSQIAHIMLEEAPAFITIPGSIDALEHLLTMYMGLCGMIQKVSVPASELEAAGAEFRWALREAQR